MNFRNENLSEEKVMEQMNLNDSLNLAHSVFKKHVIYIKPKYSETRGRREELKTRRQKKKKKSP